MRYWFSGIGGAGMYPLARLMAARGHRVAGSDRAFDQGQKADVAALLDGAGIDLAIHDGSGLDRSIDRFIYSAAVEADTPEMRRARELGLTMTARPNLLAETVDAGAPGVAIAGTSGKSTVVGMIAWILRQAQRTATILGGAALAEDGATHMGCFACGGDADPVVAEACESDGTLVGYHPAIGLIHNLGRDHDELDGLRRQFGAFAGHSRTMLVNAASAEAVAVVQEHRQRLTYGRGGHSGLVLEEIATGPCRSQGVLTEPDGTEMFLDLPQPGLHTLDNAAAAAAVARMLGVAAPVIATALACFPGVARRFQVIGTTEDGIRVIDDYAHNADKIRAAVAAAQSGCERLLAIFQPHGFGPARFLRPELKDLWPAILRPQDRLCYAGIYFAGGTTAQDISSADLVADLPSRLRAAHAPTHRDVLTWASQTAIPNDTILVMGARDPSLPALCQAILDLL